MRRKLVQSYELRPPNLPMVVHLCFTIALLRYYFIMCLLQLQSKLKFFNRHAEFCCPFCLMWLFSLFRSKTNPLCYCRDGRPKQQHCAVELFCRACFFRLFATLNYWECHDLRQCCLKFHSARGQMQKSEQTKLISLMNKRD